MGDRLYESLSALLGISIEDTFRNKTAVRAAETFWGERQSTNEIKAGEYEKLIRKVGGFGLVAVVVALGVIRITVLAGVNPDHIGTLQFFGYGLPPLIYIWTLRLIVGRWRRCHALKEDAEHRLAMLSTFMALEVDGKLTDEERILMLSALFRPQGEAEDDDVPNPVVEAILKRLPK